MPEPTDPTADAVPAPPAPATGPTRRTRRPATPAPTATAAVEAGPDTDFVTFELDGEAFAFEMAGVREIIRMPALVRLPLGPASLEGLANLRGSVLPVVSLRRRCGLAAVDHDDATRVIVVNAGTPLGLVVDRVAAVVSVEPEEIQAVEAIESALDSDLLNAVLRPGGGEALVPVLDIDRLVEGEFSVIAEEAAGAGAAAATVGVPAATDEASGDVVELVSFVVDGQEYALPIQQIQEIVQAPETMSHVPNCDARVLGVMDLRGALLPVVSLRRIFNLPQDDLDQNNRVVVVPLEVADGDRGGHLAVGVVMDTVREVLRVPHDVVDALPAFLAQAGQVAEVESVCRLDGGRRLVSVLSAERLFAGRGLRAAIESHGRTDTGAGEEGSETMATDNAEGVGSGDVDEQLVVFRVDDEEYCVNVDVVQEIIRVPEQLVRVPKSIDFVEGLVNLRGAVLPVVDLRSRLGLARVERDDRQRILVLIVGGIRTGFIVDAVAEVMKLGRGAVEDAPQLMAEQSALVSKVANLTAESRMLLIIDSEFLLAHGEVAALESVVADAA